MHLLEQAAPQEVRLRPVSHDPFAHRLREAALIAHVISRAVDPVAQPRPLGEQRLVRDLDRRAPRDGVAVEAQQAVAAERIEHGAEHPAIDRELLELTLEDSATGVVGALSEVDEPQQDLPRHIVRFVAETGQQSLSPLDQRAGYSAELLVGGVADPAAAPTLEQLGQRVLQQRQSARAVDDLPHQLGHERRLERDAVLLHGAGDGALQLERAHRGDDFGAVAEQLTETAVPQWTVIEVGAQRGDDADPTPVVGDGAHESREEPIRRGRDRRA